MMPLPTRRLRLFFLTVCLLAASACFRSAPEAIAPNIIVITIDTLRADHLGCYGYFRDTSPNIDRFSEQAILFENAFTTMATTLPAHLSLMTSAYTVTHGVKGNLKTWKRPFSGSGGIKTLAQAMRSLGYETAAFVSAAPLKPHSGIQVGFDTYDFPRGQQRPAATTNRRVFKWLARPREKPFFLWVHYFDPHAAYSPPPPYKKFFATDAQQREYLESIDVAFAKFPRIHALQNRYDGEIRYTDDQIRRVFGRIRRQGLWDNSAIVLTSDHGEGLGQHDWVGHARIYNEQLHVPLIVKFPSNLGHPARRLQRIASLVDIVPTLVEELDIAIPDNLRGPMEGINLMRSDVERPFVLAERAHVLKFALISRDWKFFHSTERPDELYNMRTDRGERHNVVEENPETSREMFTELLKIRARQPAQGNPTNQLGDSEREQEILKQLRSLGYVKR